MLAYVFWHWKQQGISGAEYEEKLRAFHAALAADPPDGYRGSTTAALRGVPWAAGGGDAYEDWYRIDGFGALGALNEAAVSAGRAAAHDAAASVASDGAGGVYKLKLGTDGPARCASWFAKPDGMRYDDLLAILDPVVESAGAAFWMRQMVLGPAREFCLKSIEVIQMPDGIDSIAIDLRQVWPE